MNRAEDRAGDRRGQDRERDRGDERRLHLRAYNCWASLLEHRPCPLSADLAPDTLAEFALSSLVLDYRGPDKPSVRLVGARLAEALPADANTTSSGGEQGSLLGRVADLCGRVLAQRSPVSFNGQLAGPRSGAILYRGILLPFASPAGDIDVIHAVVTWTRRPGGDDSIAQHDRSHVATAAQQRREPLLDWADGPSAGEETAEPASG